MSTHRELAEQYVEGADRAETLEGVQTFALMAIAHTLLALNDSLLAIHHTLQHRPPTTRLPVQLCALNDSEEITTEPLA